MYKELKKQINDKKILEDQIKLLEDRIEYKIQKELGLHSTNYQDIKHKNLRRDKFTDTFAKIEELNNDIKVLKGELYIIDEFLMKIDRKISTMNDLEKNIFRCRYIWGLSIRKTAERLNYSEQHIKRIIKKMLQE